MLKGLLLSLFLFCLTVSIQGQHLLEGNVIDENQKPLTGATVVLLHEPDSAMVAFSIVDSKGRFDLEDIANGSYILQITFLSFKTLNHPFHITEGERKINLGQFQLESTSEILQEVTVKADHIPMGLLGDTISYNAAAFKVQSGATVEDLLKKLPGVEVQRDGSIKAMGEDVENVLVDGREFFGEDPKIATQNLEAEAVDKVQVFDKKSEIAEFTGIDDGDEEKTINLQLKEGYKSGGFGNIEASGGTSSRYSSKLNYNRFSPQMQAAVIISANNINKQAFTFSEYIQFMGGLGNALSSGMSMSSLGGFGGRAPQGLNRDISGGLNFNYDFSKKVRLTSYYLYLDTERNLESETTSNQFTETAQFITANNLDSDRGSLNNRFNSKLEYKPTPFTHIVWKNSLSRIDGDTRSSATTLFEQGGIFNGQTASSIFRISDQLGYDGNIQWRQKFNKKGRNWINTTTYQNGTFDEEYDISNDYQFTSGLRSLRQEQFYKYRKEVGTFQSVYTEPLGRQYYLGVDYSWNIDKEQPAKDFYDIILEDNGQNTRNLNDALSSTYQKTNQIHRTAISLKKNSKRLKSTTRLATQRTSITGKIGAGNNEIENNSFFFLPTLDIEYDLNSDQTIDLGYNTRINLPTLNQLAPLPENSDPNILIAGNPDLFPEYVHRLELGFHLIDQFNFKNFFFNTRFERINDRIVNQVSIDENLLKTIVPENTEDYTSFSGYGSYAAPIRPLKLKFDISTQYQLSSYQSAINNRTSDVTESNIFLKFVLENRMKDYVDIASGIRLDYNTRSYAINEDFNQQFFNTRLFLDGIFYPGKEWTITAKYDYVSYSGEFFSEKQTFNLVNASIKKSFADDKISLMLIVNDLFNQNRGIQRSGDLNSLYEVRYNTLSQYFMLGLRCRIGKRKEKEGISLG